MDTSKPRALMRLLLPKTPLILKTALLNTLWLSPNASKQDLRTEVAVNLLRSFVSKPVAVGKMQRLSVRDPGVQGKMWISKVTMPQPEEDDVKEKLALAIEALNEGDETYTLPCLAPFEAEWTGYRSNADASSVRPDLSESEQYNKLMSEVKSDVTILYFHGGAYFLLDPCTFRASTSHLAHLTGGRVFSVRYRLAPKHPFPTALLDALVGYLTLLSPPPGSFHTPIPASNVVFAGDSAGGGLAMALLQTLLTLQREGIETIRFHGVDVPVVLPAAASANAPWVDITRCLPSVRHNAQYDYIAPSPDEPPSLSIPSHLVDHLWPTDPPRVELYVDAPTVIHPLVSPLAVKSELWKGAPPVYLTVGNETIEDETCVLARRLREAGARVVFEGFEGMPHCFAIMMMRHPAAKRYWHGYARFCRDVVERRVTGLEQEEESKAIWVEPFTLKERPVRFEEISGLSDEQVGELMREGRRWRVEKEEGMRRERNEPPLAKL